MFHFRPKKFVKFHKVKLNHKNSVIYRQKSCYGSYLIKSIDFFDFEVAQILVCKALITKILKSENKLLNSKELKICYLHGKTIIPSDFTRLCSFFMPLFPDFTDTAKPKETRMGKGKGAVNKYFFPVKKGKVLFELRNVNKRLAQYCINSIKSKLPGRVKLVSRVY